MKSILTVLTIPLLILLSTSIVSAEDQIPVLNVEQSDSQFKPVCDLSKVTEILNAYELSQRKIKQNLSRENQITKLSDRRYGGSFSGTNGINSYGGAFYGP